MEVKHIILSVLLIVAAIFLTVVVLLQSNKAKGLSGTIAGSAETFFGKNKGRSIDKKLNRATAIVSGVFVLVIIVVYVLLPDPVYNARSIASAAFSASPYYTSMSAETDNTDAATTTAAEAETTTAAPTVG